MLNVCSSQSVSISSCTLRRSVRALVRNRFLATCWVMVEPPCTSRRDRQIDPRARAPCRSGRARNASRTAGPRSRPRLPAGISAGRPGAAARRRRRRRSRRSGRCDPAGPDPAGARRPAPSPAAAGRARARRSTTASASPPQIAADQAPAQQAPHPSAPPGPCDGEWRCGANAWRGRHRLSRSFYCETLQVDGRGIGDRVHLERRRFAARDFRSRSAHPMAPRTATASAPAPR